MDLLTFLKKHFLEEKITEGEFKFLEPYWKNYSSLNFSGDEPDYEVIVKVLGKKGLIDLFKMNAGASYEIYKDYIGQEPFKTHLDLGTGTGKVPLFYRQQRPDLKIFASDIYDSDLLPEIHEMLKNDDLFEFKVSELGKEIPFASESCSSASLHFVLHHCATRAEGLHLLKEAHRILSPEGFLLITEEPVNDKEHKKRKHYADKIANAIFCEGFENESGFEEGHFYSEEELLDQVQSAGFTLIKKEAPKPWSWLIDRTNYVFQKS